MISIWHGSQSEQNATWRRARLHPSGHWWLVVGEAGSQLVKPIEGFVLMDFEDFELGKLMIPWAFFTSFHFLDLSLQFRCAALCNCRNLLQRLRDLLHIGQARSSQWLGIQPAWCDSTCVPPSISMMFDHTFILTQFAINRCFSQMVFPKSSTLGLMVI